MVSKWLQQLGLHQAGARYFNLIACVLKYVSHFSLLFQAHQQEEALEVDQPGCKPVPTRDASVIGSSLRHCTTALAPVDHFCLVPNSGQFSIPTQLASQFEMHILRCRAFYKDSTLTSCTSICHMYASCLHDLSRTIT